MLLRPFHYDHGQDYDQFRASFVVRKLESLRVGVSAIIRQSDCKTYSEEGQHTCTIGADAYWLLYQLTLPGKLPHAAAPPKSTTSGQTIIVKSLLIPSVFAPLVAIVPQSCQVMPSKLFEVETVSTPLFTFVPVAGTKMSLPLEQTSYLTFCWWKYEMSRLRLVHSIFTDQGTFESIVAVNVLTKLLSSTKTSSCILASSWDGQ